MQLYLFRHSRTVPSPDIKVSQWGLSAEGIELARKFAQKDAVKNLEVLYSSLQTKALETALYLAKPNGIPIKTAEDLTEVSSFTRAFFKTPEEYERNVKAFYQGKISRLAEGETIGEALNRFNKAVNAIIAAEEDAGNNYVGIVSHCNILAFFSAQFCETSPFALHNSINMPDLAIMDWQSKKFLNFYGDPYD